MGVSLLLSTGMDFTGSSRVSSCPSEGGGFLPSSNSHWYIYPASQPPWDQDDIYIWVTVYRLQTRLRLNFCDFKIDVIECDFRDWHRLTYHWNPEFLRFAVVKSFNNFSWFFMLFFFVLLFFFLFFSVLFVFFFFFFLFFFLFQSSCTPPRSFCFFLFPILFFLFRLLRFFFSFL